MSDQPITEQPVTEQPVTEQPLSDPPQAIRLDQVRSEALGERLQGLTAAKTQLDHQFLSVLAEFDRGRAWRWCDRITSTAHWLSWACSLAPGTAREHVRVARALHQLPETSRLMADGQLTYSKVRELTRLVEPEADAEEGTPEPPNLPFNEERLCGLALEMTASQLARTVRSFRHAAGTRIAAEAKRSLKLRTRDDGLTEIRVLLPTDEAALVQAALHTAQSAHQPSQPTTDVPAGTPEAGDVPAGTSERLPLVDALLDVARGYLAADTRDPDDDHHLVTVLVDAESLVDAGPLIDAESLTRRNTDPVESTCEIPALGGIEPATAARLSCDSKIIGALQDSDGHILHLGRTHRTVSRAQRRALTARDRHCQFPGCTHGRWLKAHHIVHWACGGATDLPNLMLLCQHHHTLVHEGGITIAGGPGHWQFVHPDGTDLAMTPPLSDRHLVHSLTGWAADQAARPDPGRVFPPHAGAGYRAHECVAALFRIHGHPRGIAA